MGKIKGWSKVKESKFSTTWFKDDGLWGGIMNKTKYPFVAVVREADGWNIRVVHFTFTEDLAIEKSRQTAEKVAVDWMKKHIDEW